MSQKLQSQQSEFQVESFDSPQTWVTVGGVTAINDLRSGTAAEIDVSDLQSEAKEFVLGLADNGSMSLSLLYDPEDAGQVLLETLRETSARHNFRVVIPNPGFSPQTSAFLFAGFVATFPFSIGVDAAITGTVSIRVTGSITRE